MNPHLKAASLVTAGAERRTAEHSPASEMWAVISAIQQNNRFLVTSHARPDGDAIGSSLAFAEMLRAMGKECQVVLADTIPGVYLTMPGIEQIHLARHIDASAYDIAIILECDSNERTGLTGLHALPTVNIDHHVTGSHFATLNWIDETVAAVGILVYRLACAIGVAVTPSMATCLYTALFTDTGAFTFPGTANDALPVAQELIGRGADADRVAHDVLYSVSTAHIRLLGTALSRMQLQGPTAWSYITQDDLATFGATDEDSEGTVDYLISIAGVDAAMFLRELPPEGLDAGRFRVSLRSKTRLDVSGVAQMYGGGGHQRAAGCTVPGPLDQAVAGLLHGIARNRDRATPAA